MVIKSNCFSVHVSVTNWVASMRTTVARWRHRCATCGGCVGGCVDVVNVWVDVWMW